MQTSRVTLERSESIRHGIQDWAGDTLPCGEHQCGLINTLCWNRSTLKTKEADAHMHVWGSISQRIGSLLCWSTKPYANDPLQSSERCCCVPGRSPLTQYCTLLNSLWLWLIGLVHCHLLQRDHINHCPKHWAPAFIIHLYTVSAFSCLFTAHAFTHTHSLTCTCTCAHSHRQTH